VGVTGTLMGIEANQTLLVSTNCIQPFWMQESTLKGICVDGACLSESHLLK
jgi:hypothetical protein